MRKVSEITLDIVNNERKKAFMNYGLCDDLFAGLRFYKNITTRINKRKLKNIIAPKTDEKS